MAEYGLIGDLDSDVMPRTEIDEAELTEEKKMARYSKTKEFKMFKEQLESRIEYYRHYLPGGVEYAKLLANDDMRTLGEKTVISSVIIQEFTAIIDAYTRAAEAVKDAAAKS